MNPAREQGKTRPLSSAPSGSGSADDVRVCKIVVCDDEPAILDAIRLTLTATPRFAIVADAGDAESCLRVVRETQPDLLILDVNIPGGGPCIAAAAKRIHPRLHIVVFSGRADGAIEDAMLAAGADQYVLKTGRVRPLMQALEKAYYQVGTCASKVVAHPAGTAGDSAEHLARHPEVKRASRIELAPSAWEAPDK
jgi:DNA-binding NarL/FixJ family response regulator